MTERMATMGGSREGGTGGRKKGRKETEKRKEEGEKRRRKGRRNRNRRMDCLHTGKGQVHTYEW